MIWGSPLCRAVSCFKDSCLFISCRPSFVNCADVPLKRLGSFWFSLQICFVFVFSLGPPRTARCVWFDSMHSITLTAREYVICVRFHSMIGSCTREGANGVNFSIYLSWYAWSGLWMFVLFVVVIREQLLMLFVCFWGKSIHWLLWESNCFTFSCVIVGTAFCLCLTTFLPQLLLFLFTPTEAIKSFGQFELELFVLGTKVSAYRSRRKLNSYCAFSWSNQIKIKTVVHSPRRHDCDHFIMMFAFSTHSSPTNINLEGKNSFVPRDRLRKASSFVFSPQLHALQQWITRVLNMDIANLQIASKKKNWCVPFGTQRVEAKGTSKNEQRYWNESKGRRLPSKY